MFHICRTIRRHSSLRQVKLCINQRKYSKSLRPKDRPIDRTTKRVNSRSLTKNWSALRNLFSCILSQSTFHYDSKYGSNKYEYNVPGGETGFDKQETKVQSYWNTPFSKICLGMKIDQQLKFIVLNKLANSPYSLIADGQYRNTSLGDMRYDVTHRPLCRLIVTRKGSMLWLSHHILKPESVS